MTQEALKLPPSSPAKAVACLIAADVSLVGLVAGLFLGDPVWIIVFIALAAGFFAAFLILALRFTASQAKHDAIFSLGRFGWAVASTLFWAIAFGLAVVALGYAIGVVAPEAEPLFIYAVAFSTIVFVAWSGAKGAIRRRRMLLIISHLEKALIMNLPLPRMIAAAADNEHGIMRLRLLALHDHLDRGERLDQALLHAVPEVPVRVTRAIAAGLEMGCLPHVLDSITRRRRAYELTAGPSPGFYWAYPLVIVAVISLMMIAVIPKYQGILRDFHLTLPWSTRLLVEISGVMVNDASPLLVLVLLITLIPLGRALGGLFPFFRVVPPFNGAISDQIIWWTPFAGAAVRDRAMADLCDFIAAGVEAGHPLNDTLRQAAAAQPNSVMRYRAIAFADAVSRGQSLSEAARYARMPELFSAMLATVRDDRSLLEVIGFLWRNYEFRFSRARAIAQAAYVPCVVLFFGIVVAFTGLALMSPIVALINVLSSWSTIYQVGGF